MGYRSMSIRLTDDEAAALELVAHTEGVSLAEAVRRAVKDRVASQLSTPAFRVKAQETLAERNRLGTKILERYSQAS